VISAFVTPAGLEQIAQPLLACVRRGGEVTLLLGLDRQVASPQLIDALGVLIRQAARLPGRLAVVFVVEAGGSFLHAKVFAARKAGATDLLIGSFNLTARGFGGNHELAVRLRGSAGALFDDLVEFVGSVPDQRPLTLASLADLRDALARPDRDDDSEAAKRRRADAQARLAAILQALPKRAGVQITQDAAEQHLTSLLREGGFYSYQDFSKLSVQLGLGKIYELGLLPKVHRLTAGTITAKRSLAMTASLSLVPPRPRARLRGVAKRLGLALGALGVETPFGYWVPHALAPVLHARVKGLDREMPRGPAFEDEVRKCVGQHMAKLQESTRKIVAEATAGGVEHPKRWKHSHDEKLDRIRRKGEALSATAWRRSPLYRDTVAWMQAHLLAVGDKLDAELAVGKVRRIRPRVVSIPLDPSQLTEADVRLLLECLVWAVAEDRSKKRARPAVRALTERLGQGASGKQALARLQAVSEALLEGADDATRGFFQLFGTPPYWAGAKVDSDAVDEEPDAGEDDEGDDDA
jgi:hypothetical protein